MHFFSVRFTEPLFPMSLLNAPNARTEERFFAQLCEDHKQVGKTEGLFFSEEPIKQLSSHTERARQIDVKGLQAQDLCIFQTYFKSAGMEEDEVDPFGNCLFLSLARQVISTQAEKNVYNTPTSEVDPYR